MDSLKEIFGAVEIILRYVVSGFIALLSLSYLDNVCFDLLCDFSLISPWLIFGIAIIVGISLYAIHQALFDKFFYQRCLITYLKKRVLDPRLYSDVVERRKQLNEVKSNESSGNISATEIRFELFSQSYLRRASGNETILAIQKIMDQKLALLNFLYCASYSLLISLILGFGHQFFSENSRITTLDFFHFGVILAILVVTIMAAFRLDLRVTEREMWAIQHYYIEHFSVSEPSKPVRKAVFIEKEEEPND